MALRAGTARYRCQREGSKVTESYYTRRVPLERELKLSSPEGYVPSRAELEHALGGLIVAGAPLSVQTGTLRRHQDTYFDTEDDALAARGWALRRRAAATSLTIGLKGEAVVRAPLGQSGSPYQGAALFERFELETPHSGPTPPWPGEIADVLADKVPAGTLAAVHARVVLDVVRVSHRLVHAPAGQAGVSGGGLDGATGLRSSESRGFLIELSFDEVCCSLPRADGRPARSGEATEARFHEIELEAGPDTDSRALEVVAGALAALLPLTASGVSKAERARALLAPFM